ncbi:Uncharacterized protein TCM_018180 [Theobroma cacao]|uniref:Uncharacterized protein n=1 Tax=Theobroma cacao TaxID=3641 RepID=A0A061EEF0_THECC|nr:Uncharacterized protein TCM_018180 [Theobroma cacao]
MLNPFANCVSDGLVKLITLQPEFKGTASHCRPSSFSNFSFSLEASVECITRSGFNFKFVSPSFQAEPHLHTPPALYACHLLRHQAAIGEGRLASQQASRKRRLSRFFSFRLVPVLVFAFSPAASGATLEIELSMGSKNKDQKAKSARFASLQSDLRFQKVPKHKTKVVIDSRFNRMFSNKRFSSSSAPLDKRGKPKKENSQNSLCHYYHLEDKEEEKRKNDVLSGGDDSEEVDVESESSEISKKDNDGESEEEGSESGSTTEEEDIDIIYED